MVLSKMSFSAVNIGSFYESSKILGHKLQKNYKFSLTLRRKAVEPGQGTSLTQPSRRPLWGDMNQPCSPVSDM